MRGDTRKRRSHQSNASKQKELAALHIQRSVRRGWHGGAATAAHRRGLEKKRKSYDKGKGKNTMCAAASPCPPPLSPPFPSTQSCLTLTFNQFLAPTPKSWAPRTTKKKHADMPDTSDFMPNHSKPPKTKTNLAPGEKKKANNTGCSRAVTHHSTNPARLRLSSVIGREREYS